MEKFFKLKEKNTTVKQEIIAGITTFLTMAYIVFVNPAILSATKMDQGALITATCLSAIIGTGLTGIWVNAPFAMAPGMGLNAFFAFTLVFGQGATWQEALGVVFLSGVIFVILTVTGVRKALIEAIPIELRLATGAGIGLFIAFLGMQTMGLIVDNPATLVGLGKFTKPLTLSVIGLIIMGFLEVRKKKGGILLGILITTILGIMVGEIEMPKQFVSMPPSIAPIAFKLDIIGALKPALIGSIFSFLFVDLFDSLGTILACANEAGLIDKDGKVDKIDKILEVDAASTIIGSLLGTSTVTTFVESASGIAAGGRTGLTSLTTAFCFFLTLFLSPVIGIVPGYATAPALIIVGVFMFKNLLDINLKDLETAIPCFLTIAMMPLSYSISIGLAFGFVSYVLIKIFVGKIKEVNLILWIVAFFSFLEVSGLMSSFVAKFF
ncbi:NCS2 family permease [Fusobacterium perfoetens]|uniref:NCS2 family permease n=1 Tax=Fusobacterium perfoetens TaxID=852 RepID=UPI000688CE9B|nr:NCS2 family permease [Fusobacterium perfoetens]MCI6151814.1 NCS2 family permease [Fusobacterium perfoetens]MDY3236825.1 NCS2 family permease [Fusobacterium perfoetens]